LRSSGGFPGYCWYARWHLSISFSFQQIYRGYWRRGWNSNPIRTEVEHALELRYFERRAPQLPRRPETKRHPETAARIARLRNGLTQLERLRPMFRKWADQIVEEPNAAAVAAAEATAAAARKAAWLGFARLGPLPLGADARPRCSLAVPRAVGGGGQ
jgi:hypothetical protein